MIFIKKSIEDPDISVYKQNRWKGIDGTKMPLAQRDLEKAIAYYTDPTNFKDNKKLTKKGFKYEAYAHKHTKELLKDIFKGKCAYCESSILAISPGDIEHFRPKAEIHTSAGDVLIPGYYWLGASWNNLLLSCINCNRPNKQRHINSSDSMLTGKANLFPLSDETKRLRSHLDDIEGENNFVNIINPCKDNPKNHLHFEMDGQVKALDDKGEMSIQVYGLFRAELTKDRGQIATSLINRLDILTNAVQDIQKAIEDNEPPSPNDQKTIQIIGTELVAAFDPTASFLAMKQAALLDWIQKNDVSYHRIKDVGIDLKKFEELSNS